MLSGNNDCPWFPRFCPEQIDPPDLWTPFSLLNKMLGKTFGLYTLLTQNNEPTIAATYHWTNESVSVLFF